MSACSGEPVGQKSPYTDSLVSVGLGSSKAASAASRPAGQPSQSTTLIPGSPCRGETLGLDAEAESSYLAARDVHAGQHAEHVASAI